MTRIAVLLVSHIVLLVLASTSFSILPGVPGGLRWQYFRYASQTGWGHIYHSPYTLPVVLTYVAAYGTGLIAYFAIWRRRARVLAILGMVLCALGCATFAYEATHWMKEFYASRIISFPGPLLLLDVIALVLLFTGRLDRAAPAVTTDESLTP